MIFVAVVNANELHEWLNTELDKLNGEVVSITPSRIRASPVDAIVMGKSVTDSDVTEYRVIWRRRPTTK